MPESEELRVSFEAKLSIINIAKAETLKSRQKTKK